LYRLGEVGHLDIWHALKIGDGAGDFEQPVIRSGREAKLADGSTEEVFHSVSRGTVGADLFRTRVLCLRRAMNEG